MSNDLGFNGMTNGNKGGYSTKYQHSQAKCPPNPDRINSGRGPLTAGRTGDTVPNPTARYGRINGGAAVKAARANYGRGPTRGNCC